MYFPDDELYSIGAVGILEPTDEHDNSSDASEWVLQYTSWGEDNDESTTQRTQSHVRP